MGEIVSVKLGMCFCIGVSINVLVCCVFFLVWLFVMLMMFCVVCINMFFLDVSFKILFFFI